jgi:hypothetical protein
MLPLAQAETGMRKWGVQAALALAGGMLVLFALVFCGKAARDSLRPQERYTVHFLDIDCPAPPNLTRTEFLSEVQYEASLPNELHVLEEDLPSQLTAAFTRHPWVEQVEAIQLASPNQVKVRLKFRTPVLAVPQGEETKAVDRHGVVLPKTAVTRGLPVFHGTARPYTGPAGHPWGDPAVEEAARTAPQPK